MHIIPVAAVPYTVKKPGEMVVTSVADIDCHCMYILVTVTK